MGPDRLGTEPNSALNNPGLVTFLGKEVVRSHSFGGDRVLGLLLPTAEPAHARTAATLPTRGESRTKAHSLQGEVVS
jgi:hypothetical protein